MQHQTYRAFEEWIHLLGSHQGFANWPGDAPGVAGTNALQFPVEPVGHGPPVMGCVIQLVYLGFGGIPFVLQPLGVGVQAAFMPLGGL